MVNGPIIFVSIRGNNRNISAISASPSLCLAALVVLQISIISQCPSAFASSTRLFRRSLPKAQSTIVQLFEWPWDSVASECTSFIGPAGYGYVQVSPPSEHITGSQWWTDYQVVSYRLTSKRGNRNQFSNMVATCGKAGVGVIADVVLNHMTSGSGVGFAGNSYTKYNYPAVPYNSTQFHYCAGNNVAAPVTNYDDATNVRFCELSGLADLAQEQPSVRNIMVAYLNDLLSLGVVGFRIDAAKHMEPADIGVIEGLLTLPYFDVQEVIYGANEAVQPAQYVNTGGVIDFRAPSSVLTYFSGSPGIAALVTPSPMGAAWGFVPSNVANYIMANQDTERDGTSLTSQSPNNAYSLSAIFMLGFNYGATTTVYSAYDYSSYDQGAPQNSAGYTNAVTCAANGWRCEHRWPAIANMVAYHNAVGSAALTNIFTGTSQQVAFGRGAIGFLIINNEVSTWTTTWTTSLPAGTYCDIIHDTTPDPTTCNGPSYVVSATGTLSASVAPYDALAIFTGAATLTNSASSRGVASANSSSLLSSSALASSSSANARASSSQTARSSSTASGSSSRLSAGITGTAVTTTMSSLTPASTAVTITFAETASTPSGEVLKVVGSIAQLGNWAPTAAQTLTPPSAANGPWTLTVTLPPGTSFQYKFIKVTNSGSVTWEANDNRSYTTPGAGTSVTLYGTFGTLVGSTSIGTSGGGTTTTAAPSPATTQATVTFQESASTVSGEVIQLVGSLSQLGSWAPASALAMTNAKSVWSVTVALPPNTAFLYKFIRVKSGTVSWESDPNRMYTTLGQGSSVILTSSFR
ncbi:glycoside hydrolase superfamily [Mycena galopus ATCC 62051]|nr:glycoside hydrolase superfamily [Mycena galopus ATCC 62051]